MNSLHTLRFCLLRSPMYIKNSFLPPAAAISSESDRPPGMGKLKRKYLEKAPIINIAVNGTVFVEGVSNKQHPTPVRWVQPAHVYRGNPGADGSGDMGLFPEPDISRPKPMFSGIKAFDEAPPEVQRILSLEMGRRKEAVSVVKEDFRLMTAEHKHDFKSNEVIIAGLTVKIRNAQKKLAELAARGHRNQAAKVGLKTFVDRRRAQLGHLRSVDYKKFEWLLEKLDIVYKPRPYTYECVIRRKHTERLVNLWCDEQRTSKLQSLKEEFERDQPRFLREKAETLSLIMKQEQELGVPSTVTQDDIDKCAAQAEQLEESFKQRVKQEIEYHIFEEEVVEEDHKILT
jgi:small subunit ribosomal protein S15